MLMLICRADLELGSLRQALFVVYMLTFPPLDYYTWKLNVELPALL